MNIAKEIIKLIRPHQWIKNGFVFVGIIFSHSWANLDLLTDVVISAVAFSLVSSAIYILNDYLDRNEDRQHPKKCLRPLAAGTVSPLVASTLFLFLIVAGFFLGLWVSTSVLIMLSIYAFLNFLYTVRLKHVVILDVFIIATGFFIRIMVGTVGVGITPSQWLVFCAIMLTLFLAFTKRRAEIMLLTKEVSLHRKVLEFYSPILLDKMITITASGVLISYGLYTMSPNTIAIHNTENLIYTFPFVMYAIFRYIFILHGQQKGGDPSIDLIKDPHIILSVALWGGLTAWLIS